MLRRFLLLAFVGIALGCSNPVASTEPSSTGAAPASQPSELKPAGDGQSGSIGIFHNGDLVHVGDGWQVAKNVFPSPRNAYDLHDLPDGIPNTYEAHGWETPSGEGYGIVTSEAKVATAMYQLDRTNQDTFEELLKEQQDGMGAAKPVMLNGRSLHFWFWKDPQHLQTLMVCELATNAGLNVTIAAGDDNVLQRLNISPESARAEISQLDKAPGPNPAIPPKN